ncbi:MAG: hypothetical protein OEX04_04195 [Acidimicrobiia bacterium]|nr:hypothetical protein [Acidimicrobiia bacterium]
MADTSRHSVVTASAAGASQSHGRLPLGDNPSVGRGAGLASVAMAIGVRRSMHGIVRLDDGL